MPKIVALITVRANTGIRAYVGHNSWHMRYICLLNFVDKLTGNPDLTALMTEVYGMAAWTNPLHPVSF